MIWLDFTSDMVLDWDVVLHFESLSKTDVGTERLVDCVLPYRGQIQGIHLVTYF